MLYLANMEDGGSFEAHSIEALVQQMARYYAEQEVQVIDIKSIVKFGEQSEIELPAVAVGYIGGQAEEVMDYILKGQGEWLDHMSFELRKGAY